MKVFSTLRSRLLVATLLLVSVVIATGLIAVRLLTPLLFERGMHAGNPAAPGRADRGLAVSVEVQAAYDRALTQSVLVAGAVGLIAALVLAVVFGNVLLGRLGPMQLAAHRLADGDYDHALDIPAEAELAELARSINTLGASLAATEESRARLMSDVAHELRNPLTTIEGYLEGLIDGVLPANDETFGVIADEAHRMRRITEDLSFMSKAEEGAATYEQKAVDLGALAAGSAARLRPHCDEKGVRLEQAIVEALPVVGDAARLTQVVDNLLQNALAHTPSGGTITITGHRDRACTVEITDTGDGMAADQLAVIFERFVRFRTGPGLGIGLNIARSIVEGHDGRLTADSPGPGRGAVFAVRLPVANDDLG